ncbi:uncharacterized protein LOC127288980 [Leptopilina boulardi]|uniref:uncharacterized protein LOC127288980 n=1 Tax=Leptopilina boulardi TaxID=63433 RepID=UPI0021F65540|nr:uncharacterized protein LOC127288980 [Leptopilina boulardi]
MSSDILEPLPLEKWQLLAEKLKKNWPANVQYYYFVHTAKKWKTKEPNIPITIYCLNADYNSGIFVSVSDFTIYSVIAFAHEGFEKLLYKAVTESKFIKWNKGVFLPAIQLRLVPTVYSIIDFLKVKKNLEIEWNVPGNCFFKSKEECAVFEVQVPDDCYLKELDDTHIPLIHSVWPHRNEENPELSTRHVMAMVKFNGGLGLFSKDTNELLSWAVQSELGAISLVQTIDRCKRRGYAKIVTNAIAKELAMKEIDSFLFIVKGNIPSESMFSSLNWKHLHETDWIQTKEFTDVIER